MSAASEMKHRHRIPGVSPLIYSEVLASQYSKESPILTKDSSLKQSDFFEPLMFFLGVSYNISTSGNEVIKIETYFRNRQDRLSDFELGIYYHLKGFLYSKRGFDNFHIVFDALKKSIDHLNAAESKASKYYLARVFDTYGQVLQTIGFIKDALLMYEESLKIKKEFKDEPSVALTHGNLGRLYFEIGNIKAAVKHLKLDLKIIKKSTGQENLESKLMNQIALGLIELKDFPGARKYIDQSISHSKAAGLEGAFFATYTLAYYYLLNHEVIELKKIISTLRQLLSKEVKNKHKVIYQSRVDYLSALYALFNGRPSRASILFQNAEGPYIKDFTNSITEKARFYFYQSQASDKSGHNNESSFQLRKALSLLDQTENVTLRKDYEGVLKKRHREGWLIHSAGRFIGQEQIEMILNDAGRDGFQDKSSEIAIMFSDIRDFTKLSEGLSADNLIELLNSYFSTMSKYIHLQHGVLDKYIGDAIMALFLPNNSTPSSIVENACISALMMKYELIRFNRYLPESRNRIQAGIAINFGRCVSGMIGTPQKRSLSVIGDAVNIASRMEGLTKLLGASIIISEPLYSRLPKNHNFIIRPLGKYRLMGKSIPLSLAELMGIDNNSKESNSQKQEILVMEKVLLEFSSANFAQAYKGFIDLSKLTEKHDRSVGYEYMAGYTKNLLNSDIPKDWDGSFQLVVK